MKNRWSTIWRKAYVFITSKSGFIGFTFLAANRMFVIKMSCFLTARCLNACHRLLSAIGSFFYLGWLCVCVCVCLYTDNTVVLVTCLFSSGCCQRTERGERRACCPGACELLTVLVHLYLSKWLTAWQKLPKWIIFLCGFVMKSETKVALFKLGAIFFNFFQGMLIEGPPGPEGPAVSIDSQSLIYFQQSYTFLQSKVNDVISHKWCI